MNRLFSHRLFLIPAFFFLTNPIAPAQTAKTYLITGRVHDELNRGVDRVTICAVPEDYAQTRNATCTLSDAAGYFVIRTESVVLHRIFPEKSGDGYEFQRPLFYRNPSISIIAVMPTEANTAAPIQVPLGPKNGAIIGRSVDTDTGKRIESVRFLLCQAANPLVCWSFSAKSTAGNFRFLAAHVPFTLKATAAGYEDWWGLNGDDKNPISVAAGDTLNLELNLRRQASARNLALDESEKDPLSHLPAPKQTTPADGVELTAVPRVTKLEWEPVETAVSYRIEVDYCDGFKSRRECLDPQPHASIGDSKLVQTTSFEFAFVGAQPGRWRVSAIDANGKEGFKSPWWTFFHLR